MFCKSWNLEPDFMSQNLTKDEKFEFHESWKVFIFILSFEHQKRLKPVTVDHNNPTDHWVNDLNSSSQNSRQIFAREQVGPTRRRELEAEIFEN